ncbi:transposase domain-containing protein [Streptomyces asiaticus]|uniref:transposase domain-containing protein n=1 Tax=Streptomyces asiaticus TaxID=114695 RepID=UPI00374D1473
MQSVITREIAVFAPGHLGELTQVVDFALVDAVVEETGTVQMRIRLLPSRVVVDFVLALALFERCSYRVH